MVTPAWVIVNGRLGRHSGQDRPNFELARYLVERGGTRVHVVAHKLDDELRSNPAVTFHEVRQPLGSGLLGGPYLDAAGRRVAAQVTAATPGARVVVNGGNCHWPDVGWVHSVLSAWPQMPSRGPWLGRIKERYFLWQSRRMERQILPACRLLIANSRLTREELVRTVGAEERRIQVVYYGAEPAEFGPPTAVERRQARDQFGLGDADDPVIAFVGALGYSTRKGFDTLLDACALLSQRSDWRGKVLAAGAGRLAYWEQEIQRRSLQGRVRLLGHTTQVPALLAAADVLVSPARHEAFGLNVHEALCRGLPAMVTAKTGVAEVYPPALGGMLLADAEDGRALADKLSWWFRERDRLSGEFAALGAVLRERAWRQMASELVGHIEATAGAR